MTKGRRLRLKTRVDEEKGSLPSVTGVFRAAGWNERECFDMFGLRFEGHTDLRRMYMPEDFEYHPLRKEFPLLGVPGSLPLPPQTPEAGLTLDPFAAAHGSKPIKSYEEASSDLNDA
jgi:NADH-quinone oxidoreductase subunit C